MALLKHIISIDDLSTDNINKLFEYATICKNEDNRPKLQTKHYGKIITNLFYEPSTRTSSSFLSAANRLGITVNQINSVSYSSVVKGETLTDTILTLSQYSDAIILRHNVDGSAKIAANITNVPIINAGDGIGEHPTQALLDFYTIKTYQHLTTNSVIGFVGDLKHGRTVHSLVKLLIKFGYTKFRFISSNDLQIPYQYMTQDSTTHNSIDEIIHDVDVLYMTRLQKERLPEHLKSIVYGFSLSKEHLRILKPSSVVMHPLPRQDELSPSLDGDKRLIHLEQMKNGLYIRMACLHSIFSDEHIL